MHNNSFPLFTKGKVVKKEALESLRDFPYTLASVAFDHLSDGILCGCSISFDKDKNTVTVSKGALKFKGNIILVHENELLINEFGTLLYIKLVLGDCCEKDDFKIYPVELKINNKGFEENELELGRFILNKNAILRCKYDFFDDFQTPVNTLDITRCSFAGIGGATLHPYILKSFAKSLLENSSDVMDATFAFLCLNSDIIHKNSIEWYIAKKNGSAYREYRIDELYKKLVEILSHNMKKDAPVGSSRRSRPQINL